MLEVVLRPHGGRRDRNVECSFYSAAVLTLSHKFIQFPGFGNLTKPNPHLSIVTFYSASLAIILMVNEPLPPLIL